MMNGTFLAIHIYGALHVEEEEKVGARLSV
jgi:hypothetical protein